jgi:hypothetical protein
MQVEVVRHHRGAKDADRQDQRAGLGQARQIGHGACGEAAPSPDDG